MHPLSSPTSPLVHFSLICYTLTLSSFLPLLFMLHTRFHTQESVGWYEVVPNRRNVSQLCLCMIYSLTIFFRTVHLAGDHVSCKILYTLLILWIFKGNTWSVSPCYVLSLWLTPYHFASTTLKKFWLFFWLSPTHRQIMFQLENYNESKQHLPKQVNLRDFCASVLIHHQSQPVHLLCTSFFCSPLVLTLIDH